MFPRSTRLSPKVAGMVLDSGKQVQDGFQSTVRYCFIHCIPKALKETCFHRALIQQPCASWEVTHCGQGWVGDGA